MIGPITWGYFKDNWSEIGVPILAIAEYIYLTSENLSRHSHFLPVLKNAAMFCASRGVYIFVLHLPRLNIQFVLIFVPSCHGYSRPRRGTGVNIRLRSN